MRGVAAIIADYAACRTLVALLGSPKLLFETGDARKSLGLPHGGRRRLLRRSIQLGPRRVQRTIRIHQSRLEVAVSALLLSAVLVLALSLHRLGAGSKLPRRVCLPGSLR